MMRRPSSHHGDRAIVGSRIRPTVASGVVSSGTIRNLRDDSPRTTQLAHHVAVDQGKRRRVRRLRVAGAVDHHRHEPELVTDFGCPVVGLSASPLTAQQPILGGALLLLDRLTRQTEVSAVGVVALDDPSGPLGSVRPGNRTKQVARQYAQRSTGQRDRGWQVHVPHRDLSSSGRRAYPSQIIPRRAVDHEAVLGSGTSIAAPPPARRTSSRRATRVVEPVGTRVVSTDAPASELISEDLPCPDGPSSAIVWLPPMSSSSRGSPALVRVLVQMTPTPATRPTSCAMRWASVTVSDLVSTTRGWPPLSRATPSMGSIVLTVGRGCEETTTAAKSTLAHRAFPAQRSPEGARTMAVRRGSTFSRVTRSSGQSRISTKSPGHGPAVGSLAIALIRCEPTLARSRPSSLSPRAMPRSTRAPRPGLASPGAAQPTRSGS